MTEREIYIYSVHFHMCLRQGTSVYSKADGVRMPVRLSPVYGVDVKHEQRHGSPCCAFMEMS